MKQIHEGLLQYELCHQHSVGIGAEVHVQQYSAVGRTGPTLWAAGAETSAFLRHQAQVVRIRPPALARAFMTFPLSVRSQA